MIRDLADRVRDLESLVDRLSRTRRGAQPNMRDLSDADLTKVVNGQVMVYRSATGRWYPLTIVPNFTRNGALAVGISDKWPVIAPVRLRRMYGLLTTAATSGPTTFRLLRNGSPVTGASVTIAAGAFSGPATFDQTFTGPEADYAQTELTAVGTGAAGLTVVYT
ncbi:MAG: hypothetical protein WKF86_00175 [Acidimicrobiales bacterium]